MEKRPTGEEQSLRWLSGILDTLRKECPWDREQTIESLRYLTIEEVYEMSEAIEKGDYEEIRKELGDIVMHVLFYAKIAEEEGRFTMEDVLDGVSKKLIQRHPHIALPDKEGKVREVENKERPRWEVVKKREGRQSIMEGVPSGLPSMVKAIRIQEKAAGVGFDYATAEGSWGKVEEEYGELKEAIEKETQERQEEEYGDLLFAMVKWGRKMGYNADSALTRTNQKFCERFARMESIVCERGGAIEQLSTEEMTELWKEAKETEKGIKE